MSQSSEKNSRGRMIRRVTSRIVTTGLLGAIVFAAACSDATGPTPVTPPAVTPPPVAVVPQVMIDMAGSIDPMTEWFLQWFEDQTAKSNIQGMLSGLKGHLSDGKVLLSQQDVTAVRGVLGSLDDTQRVELAPIDRAMDVVDELLTKVSGN